MTLYITIVNLNCEPLKQGLKIYMVFFYTTPNQKKLGQYGKRK